MATFAPLFIPSGFTAGADLSVTGQHRFVSLGANKTVTLTGNNALALGVLMNQPESGDEAQVLVAGIAKVEAGEAVAVNDKIGSDANGRSKTALTASEMMGIAITPAAAAGVIHEVLLLGGSFVTP